MTASRVECDSERLQCFGGEEKENDMEVAVWIKGNNFLASRHRSR